MDINALFKVTYGMYIIGSCKENRINALIATTICQVTAEPPKITVTLNKQNLTHEFIEASKCFSVSILEKDTDMIFIGRFGFRTGWDYDKFNGINYKIGRTGSPIVLDNAVGYIEAEVTDSVDVGTHTIFVANITDAQILSDKDPISYAYYHEIKGGKSPKTAPTYVK